MFRPRIIPVLLLKNLGLVKSIKFKNHRYIGDPINAVKIFNDSAADEIVFLDILATKENRTISLEFVKNVGEEAKMPFAVGGGINNIEKIKSILAVGAEKVVLGSAAINLDFVNKASNAFGSSSIVVCIDVKKNLFGKYVAHIHNAQSKVNWTIEEYVKLISEAGAGEIIIQSIDRDGTFKGYDIELIKSLSDTIKNPVIALGGASSLDNMKEAWLNGYASAVAAGSLFVYHGARNGILVNYPTRKEILNTFKHDE